MKYLTTILCLTLAVLLGSAGVSWSSEDQPRESIVYHTTETAYRSYNCKPLPTGQIECEFLETRVRKHYQPIEVAIKEARRDWGRNKLNVKTTLLKMCDASKKLVSILDGKSNAPIPPKSKRILETLTETAKRDYLRSSEAIISFCKKQSLENFLEITRLHHDKKKRTCFVGSPSYKKAFNRMGPLTWSAVSTPQGNCGIVSLDRFEQVNSGGTLNLKMWNYISKKAVTNPSGKDFLGRSCKMLNENEYKWSWKPREIPMDCDYIVPRPN